ncbi:MAG: leucyl/phenylalanyl-tRNA--protein transferase [Desulfobulbaceae bacterium]|nr:MAG: leucyl/phenylalanyl-tRNA--protein transferase [Desulfobulbaceae bacterium]
MPVFKLIEEHVFPHPNLAEPNGLLAVGGDLTTSRLIAAYRHGIFPWFSEGDPILWWFTSPRLILVPEELKVSKRLNRYWNNNIFTMTINKAFDKVIEACASVPRRENEGTWITREMISAYKELHQKQIAHSVECWQGSELVGGLYGLALGKVFFGESMFSGKPNCSKLALIHLVNFLKSQGYQMIDCQMTTDHLISLGAREISGEEFQRLLKEYITSEHHTGVWPHEKKC